MKNSILAWTIVLCAAAASGPAVGQALDGKAPAVCAVSQAFDCASADKCVADAPEAINIPRLIRLDFAGKKAFTKRTGGEERVAPIAAQHAEANKLILIGIQGGYGWTMAISQESGAMSLTVVDADTGIVVFGTCMAL